MALLPNFPLVLPFLYAEIHYTLGGFSFIHRKRPEILSDAPTRVDPGRAIPLLILVKDAHKHPVRINHVEVRCRWGEQKTVVYPFGSPVEINATGWHHIETIRPPDGFYGEAILSVCFDATYLKTAKSRTFYADNLPGGSHLPFRVHVAKDPLPKLPGWHFGDLHHHSFLTTDQVEYGAPLEATAAMAGAMGLSFTAITDHSYDLDDRWDDYLKNDPALPKWKYLHGACDRISSESGIWLIPGEEVSCANRFGNNVHLLVLNHPEFLPGSGDSNERWFRNRAECRIPQILDRLSPESLAFAAHPGVRFAPLQWLLLRRGVWKPADYEHPNLFGLQFYNGREDGEFRNGMKHWIFGLLQGHRRLMIAGNDAHGGFNRHRKLGQPFLYLTESQNHTYGRGRTGLYLPEGVNRSQIMRALKSGRSCISTGPFCTVEAVRKNRTRPAGEGVRSGSVQVIIEGVSSEEFGGLNRFRLWQGVPGEEKERLLLDVRQFSHPYHGEAAWSGEVSDPAYFRAELFSRKNGRESFCMTNPVWVGESQ